MAYLAPNQTAYLALNQEAYLAPNQTAYLAPNQEAYLALNQMAYLAPDQTAHLAPDQMPILRCNLLAALSSPFSVCRLAWIEAADAAVKAAKEKAEDVHGRLDHNKNDASGTVIGQGIGKIEEAKDKVKQVDKKLSQHIDELGTWKSAAHSVLSTAVEKAEEVRGKLNPDGKDPIGQNIDKIHTSNEAIKEANEDLKSHVDSLSTWISTAEDIRAKAQQKAEDAYKKLDVNAELSNNVKKIVDANKAIEGVHKSLNGVHGNLETWNAEAKKVLQGAIEKATEVHDALEDKSKSLGENIDKIDSAGKQIEKANSELGNHVKDLTSWNSAAQGVIGKAEGKCNTILEKVSTTNPQGPIFQNAQTLESKGIKLLDAVTKAKKAVEENVTEALQAVVTMDGDLKRDLRTVREEIKRGITEVITSLRVNDLGDLVKGDLKTLKENISELANGMEGNDKHPLVESALSQLKEQKDKLNVLAGPNGSIKKETDGLQDKFENAIQQPLKTLTENVDKAIEVLGGNFGVSGEEDKKKLEKIFGHIKGKVAEIKGNGGSGWENTGGKGLDGIKSKVNFYFGEFSEEYKFNQIVKGWIEKTIMPHNGLVSDRIKNKIFGGSTSNAIQNIANGFKEQLKIQADAAGGVVQAKNGSGGDIAKSIQAVKAGCEAFADDLDGKLKEPDSATSGIVSKVKEKLTSYIKRDAKCICYCSHCRGTECKQNSVTAVILGALAAVSRQVGNELNSVFLSPDSANIAGILDTITPIAEELDEKLKAATNNSLPPPGQKESPAQAVDKRLGEVRNEVSTEIERKFRDEVTRDLKSAVGGLEEAVNQFDGEAQKQIKNAARTAIDKAAEQIKEEKSPIVLGQNKLMEQFNTQFTTIKSSLEHQLKQQVNNHIREDDPPGLAGGQQQKFILAKQYFTGYDNHVKQEAINKLSPGGTLTGKPDEGHLPQAIGNIKNQGLAELKIIDPPGGTGKIDTNTFTVPFTQIQTELDDIKKLVENKQGTPPGGKPNGAKDYLGDLRGMVTQNGECTLKSDVDPQYQQVQGLDAIHSKIHGLQTGTLGTKPAAIEEAVQEIRKELGELRQKLKNEKDQDVIERLKDLRDSGLGGHWNDKNGDWRESKGLKVIQHRLEIQNYKLPEQTAKIENAINEINRQLHLIGYKLDHPVEYDDVIDRLTWLGRKIGRSEKGYRYNLEDIYQMIKWLQEEHFINLPDAIGTANSAIKEALKAQMSTLDTDVIKTLTNLMTTGLSDQASWQPSGHEAAKGFDHIISELNTQQGILTTQPGDISGGVQKITVELDALRKQLQGKDAGEPKERGVIRNMELMIKQIGKGKGNGLECIEKAIEELNRETVPKVSEYVDKLCAEIRLQARDAKFFLESLEEGSINERLSKITNDIHTLSTDDLQEAIRMCTDFLRDADYIKWEKVENIERFVDSEIEKAIAELSKQARRDYVESARDALKHFADKVAEELRELPGDIEHDLTIGFKGFMAKLENGFVKNIQKINGIDFKDFKNRSPLSQVAEKVSEAVHGFFPELMQQEEFLNGGFPKSSDPVNPKNLTDEQVETLESMPANMLQFMSLIDALDDLIQYIEAGGHFDFPFTAPLNSLKKQLGAFTYDAYNDGQRALLRPLKNGINNIHVELGNAYISTYSGQEFTAALVEPESAGKNAAQSTDLISWQNSKLTPYGEKLCKVFLSLLPILGASLAELRLNCRSLAGQRLNSSTDLGRLLADQGYRVPDDGQRSGELDSHVTGRKITMLLVGDYKRVFNTDNDTKNALGILLECLNDYYAACHYATLSSTRSPCNVYEMLVWLTGLPHNCVYDKLCKFTKLCYDEQTENSLYAATFPADALVKAVGRLTADCPSILTRVLGFGDAMTTYACDFHNNSTQLYYPQDGEDCLHLLFHLLRVLLSVLRFLSTLCSLPVHHGGWAECRYGKGVPPYTWQCSLPVTALPTPHPECTDKSPLMSYLNDCLPGHLPHQVAAIGCEPKCNTCPSGPDGTPCLTPLGFRGFSGSTKTGKQLCRVLTKLFTNEHLSPLLSLCPRPPATLAEHIGFALSLVNDWHDGNIVPKNSLQQALEASATDLSLRLYNQTGDLTAALTAAYGSDSAKHGGCKHPHLTHLAGTDVCTRHQASPFLQALCRDSYDSLAHRHSGLYLSWAVYLPWTFYDLLQCLYTAFKEISCRDWSCDACLHEGPCDPDSHGVLNPKAPVHGCRCPSIVQCTGVMPTLYQYGLTFKDAPALISQNTTCFSFSTQLSQVLHSEYFRDLFHKCDEFLWHIRMPFLFTIVTLWLIATLYIAHSLLYRMDVLRIRSHLLTTRASHLIDVKALLAGSRRMLSLYKDVDYFDDDFHS
ncbi:hypothetical protein, conserved [Babesia ovata]|uniref:Extracellular matrix-binding ebh n=1 Tax=Babesia ovata TaxID=189622 RepID=A0A2H6KJ35_9APIC|nr:uncharacterized protein BOVATA_044820 [Babesia ovata]GBE62989.1 hypothetical protein, conserved [Babesia ovata]